MGRLLVKEGTLNPGQAKVNYDSHIIDIED
jgi:hypothetical protein